jgi:hypothetical protein
MYRSILVPLDGSPLDEHALHGYCRAGILARRYIPGPHHLKAERLVRIQ